ncbi:restriction endonuclease subunit S [Chlorogloea sp. CCALA 695]|uniref:restriction endonuclease subunit S n=1 Tax=Chlorogloea sp. CCALA 695 TaxID=2107693 RepID=UPI000D04D44D|nr:restriction endonuclease subunit S [Chlorogloea sp. CCALA 695]PSB32840.1 restriction endonuclease subunit S [Chlorogloea sp. CCALA 695]
MKSYKQNTILSELITLQRGFDLPESNRQIGNIPVVASSGVVGFHNEAKVKAPGVVIGRSGSIGGGQYITEDFWPLNTTLWVKDFKDHNPRFIYYLLKNIDFSSFNGGSGVPTLNRNHIANIKAPSFDQKQENKIADILSKYDDLIENNRRRIELLEESARSLYREWFVYLRFPGHEHTPIIDGIPDGWEKKKIEEICETVGGGTPSTQNHEYWSDGNITWVVPTDVTRNNCLALLNSERKITEAGLKNSSAKLVPSETILMTSRASVGFFALMDQQVCTNQGFINIIPNQKNYRMYLLHNLMYRVEEIRSYAGGSTYQEINKTRFRNLDIVIPSKTLLQQFQEQSYKILQQVRLLNKQIAKLNQARDLLLPRLMNGEIAV